MNHSTMHQEDTSVIGAAAAAVYHHLMDPDAVAACSTWLRDVQVDNQARTIRAILPFQMGQLSARMGTLIRWHECVPPERVTLLVSLASGGTAVDVVSTLHLTPLSPTATQVRWTIDAGVPENLRPLLQQIMGQRPQQLASRFFTCLQARLEPSPGQP